MQDDISARFIGLQRQLQLKRFTKPDESGWRNNSPRYPAINRRAIEKRFLYWLFLCLFFLTSSLSAQTTPDNSSAPSAELPPSRWQWSLTVRNRTGLRTEEPRVLQMSRTILDAKAIYKLNENWRMTLEARAHFDPVERLGYPNNVWLDPRQAVIEGKIKKVDVKFGLQQVVWGQADGLRVLDVINPLDYREFILEDFLDSRRPLWMARADVPIEKGSLQFVWVPYFAPGRLGTNADEFGLGLNAVNSLITARLQEAGAPIPAFASRAERTQRPAYKFGSSQIGLRYSRSVGSWDVTVNYFYGWEDTPTYYFSRLETNPNQLAPTLVFAPRYDRREVIGATAANNFGPVVLRLEAGWNRDKTTAVKSGSYEKLGQFSSVVGADYSPREWVWLSGQYFLQFTSAPQQSLVFPRYNHLASFFVRMNFFRDTLRPEFFVLTGLNQKQYMIRPRLTKVLNDHWSVSAGADFLGGRATNIFGHFNTRDRVVIELKWMK